MTVEAENQVRTAKVVKGLGAGKDVKGRRGNFLGHLMDEKKYSGCFWDVSKKGGKRWMERKKNRHRKMAKQPSSRVGCDMIDELPSAGRTVRKTKKKQSCIVSES